jgi:hypothetical protein
VPEPLDPLVKAQRELERLRIDNANLRGLNKKLLRRGGGYDQFIEELEEILATDNKFKYASRSRVKLVQPYDPSHEEIAVVANSDLHLTENVRLQDSNGINVYNSMVAANRLWLYSQKVKSILARHMAMYKLTKIWSPILGDMINGSIHPEMIATNDLSDPAAVILCTRLLYMFYQELKPLGLPIDIDTIHGNHPRLTLKMPTKRQAHTNLDWLIYENLADRLEKDDQFTMTVHTGQIGMKQLYGHNYIFEHGIDVRNGQEEAFEDRIRALFDDQTYRKATGYQGAAFDQLLIGNMHKPKFLERTIVNGTYTGQNELGMGWRLKPIKAAQLMWGISQKHVRTWEYQVDLTDVRSERPENPFSEYTKWYLAKHGK